MKTLKITLFIAFALVLASGAYPVFAETCGTMQSNSAIRGCSNYVEWAPVFQPSADACKNYCGQNNADACEWFESGDCYVEFGSGCFVQPGFSEWHAAVMTASACSAPPPPSGGGNCDTSSPQNQFRVCYFDGTSAPTGDGQTLSQFIETNVPNPVGAWAGFNNDWGSGQVDATGKSDSVSGVWRGRINFQAGTYTFRTRSDDGVELNLEGFGNIISNWNVHAPTQDNSAPITLPAGQRNVRLRWFEEGGGAVIRLWWDFTPAPACGNGVREGSEQCDAGGDNGVCPKSCSSSCTLNNCPVCGNGVQESGEQCDAGANNGACPRTCSSSCTLNSCQVCGNGIVEGTEQCDGTNLNSQTCSSRGYTSGALSCTSSCTFNTTSCISSSNILSTTVISDNTAPAVSVAINDTRSPIPPGTSISITATASDANGLSSVNIFVDGTSVRTCASSPCVHSFAPAYGSHGYYASATDVVGNTASTATGSFIVNNAPTVSPISFTGACVSGGTITLRCDAVDPNQAANTLTVNAWAGQCDGANCFNTRSWATGTGTTYLVNSPMTAPASGGTFTRAITITQPSGTAIAATCQASDALGAQSNWGDAYPLCIVDGCQNPPVITVNSVVPDPSRVGDVLINFTSDRALNTPVGVTVRPGSQSGGTVEYPATFVSRIGNTYVYSFTVISSYMNSIADIRISGNDNQNNCPVSKVEQFTIDTAAPSTSILCNGAACTSQIYRPLATLTLPCSDATTACNVTYYTVNGGTQQAYNSASPPVLSSTGVFNINYWSTDLAGNIESAKNRQVQVYAGTGNEQALVRILSLRPKTVLFGQTVNGNISCFLRDVNTGLFTRMCNIDQNGISIIIDRGTVKQKDYFTSLGVTKSNFLAQNRVNVPSTVLIDAQQYNIEHHWRVPLDTNIFRSEICVNMTDGDSGLSGEQCDNYTVSNSQLLPQITFPDVTNLIIPTTITGAPNFTKTMPIRFNSNVKILTGFSSSDCTDVNCRVEYSFVPFSQWDPVLNPPHVASWSGFANSYVPNDADVSSNYFACDQYKTLYVRATKQGGSENGIIGETQSDFFVNCNIKVTVNPVEKRLVLGAQPGNIFDVTVWNPKEGADRAFTLESMASDSYVYSWINFQCDGQMGCSVDPVNNDLATLVIPQVSSRTIKVNMPSAVRSGAFPITFVATENGTQYSTLGTILVFVEGLDEFAIWQFGALLILAIVIFAYSGFDINSKRHRIRK